jgi:(4S)-4-hydroxy-5-phosphonooxypentane-2,3-dione isomerase
MPIFCNKDKNYEYIPFYASNRFYSFWSHFIIFVKKSIMFIVHVFIQVKEEMVEDFKKATIENSANSIQEPGIARFDFIQQKDDPARFVLVEVYRTQEDSVKHKETDHYKKWRDTVAGMMAEPRSSIKFSNVYPDEEGWG